MNSNLGLCWLRPSRSQHMGYSRNVPRILIIFAATLLLMGHVVSRAEGLQIDHELQVVADNTVDLRCDFDVDNCGPVHSLKIYKGTERVFTFHNNTVPPAIRTHEPLSKGRVRFDVKNAPGTLHISRVYLMDEGLYQCEITYLHIQEHCKTITVTNLIILAKPSPPEIRFDYSVDNINKQRIGPFVENTKLTLICESKGGKPEAQVTWKNGSEIILGAESKNGINAMALTISRADLHSRFECQAENDALDAPLTTWVEVDVHVKPLTIDVTGPDGHVTESDSISLECEVTGARPAATISWFNGTQEVEGMAFDQEKIDEDGGYTYTTRSKYTFETSRFDDKKKVRCVAENTAMEGKEEEQMEDDYLMDVYYAPRVSIVPEGSLTANYSDSLTLRCYYEANPMNLSEVIWYRNKKPILLGDDDSDENGTGENGDDESSDEDYDTEERIVLSMGTASDDDDDDNGDETGEDDDGTDEDDDNNDDKYPSLSIKHLMHVDKGMYTCKVTNEVKSVLSSTLLNLDVLYPPLVEMKMDPEDVKEEEDVNVTFSCHLRDANPFNCDGYSWMRDGINFDETEDNILVLYDVDRDETANYSCAGHNIMGWGIQSKQVEMVVKYAPGAPIVNHDPAVLVKGQNVKLTCEVKDLGEPPVYRYRWYRGDVLLVNAIDKEHEEVVTLKTLTNFSCAAVNDVGEGPRAMVAIDITAAPSFIQNLTEVFGVLVDAENATLSCQVECWPRCSIRWLKNKEPIDSQSPLYSIENKDLPIDYEHSYLHSILSTLFMNFTAWPEGHLNRGVDNANYTCYSKENFVGKGVSSTTFFQIEFPPEDINLSREEITLMVNGTAPPITCNAVSNPAAKYWWQFGDETVSATNVLYLNYSIQKEQSGIYTCVAANQYGNKTADVLIDVQYKPECEIEKDARLDGKIVITCTVLANPENVTFEWMKEDQSVTENAITNGLTSILQFQEAEEHYGTYTCSVSNIIGETEPDCSIEITGKGGWLETLAENKTIFVTAAVVASILLSIVVISVIICVLRRRAAAKAAEAKKGEPDDKALYENLPFHGLQPPPDKPFRPTLPDLEYADVEFPAQSLNNNKPQGKAKIVERMPEDLDDESLLTDTPMRPPRTKASARK